MRKRMNILIAVTVLATLGVVGCGSDSNNDSITSVGDTVAPAAVANLSGQVKFQSNPTVELIWKSGPELDLDSYNIYRSENGGPSTLVASVPMARWTDQSTSRGSVYVYSVSALDTSQNEGARASTPAIHIGDTSGGKDSVD